MSWWKRYKKIGLGKNCRKISKKVRALFSDSKTPDEWIFRLIEEFDIDEENERDLRLRMVCRKVCGVSEVFNVVQREMDESAG